MTCIGPRKRHRKHAFMRRLNGERMCVRCEFEEAADTPEVLVEIRAAEIAARTPQFPLTIGEAQKHMNGAEIAGWIEHAYDSDKVPEQDGEWAGWLARVIATHGDAP